MAYAYDVTCDGCSYSQLFVARGNIDYQLPDGRTTPAYINAVWCLRCVCITPGETLRTEEEVKERIQNQSGLSRQWARVYLDMLRMRRSGARCIACGSTDILPGKGISQPWPHPGCPSEGILHLERRRVHIHDGIGPWLLLSPEGEPLPQEESETEASLSGNSEV